MPNFTQQELVELNQLPVEKQQQTDDSQVLPVQAEKKSIILSYIRSHWKEEQKELNPEEGNLRDINILLMAIEGAISKDFEPVKKLLLSGRSYKPILKDSHSKIFQEAYRDRASSSVTIETSITRCNDEIKTILEDERGRYIIAGFVSDLMFSHFRQVGEVFKEIQEKLKEDAVLDELAEQKLNIAMQNYYKCRLQLSQQLKDEIDILKSDQTRQILSTILCKHIIGELEGVELYTKAESTHEKVETRARELTTAIIQKKQQDEANAKAELTELTKLESNVTQYIQTLQTDSGEEKDESLEEKFHLTPAPKYSKNKETHQRVKELIERAELMRSTKIKLIALEKNINAFVTSKKYLDGLSGPAAEKANNTLDEYRQELYSIHGTLKGTGIYKERVVRIDAIITKAKQPILEGWQERSELTDIASNVTRYIQTFLKDPGEEKKEEDKTFGLPEKPKYPVNDGIHQDTEELIEKARRMRSQKIEFLSLEKRIDIYLTSLLPDSDCKDILGQLEKYKKELHRHTDIFQECDVFFMLKPESGMYKNSDLYRLYLYKGDSEEIFYYIQGKKITLPLTMNELKFDQNEGNPVNCNDSKICETALTISAKNGHTLLPNNAKELYAKYSGIQTKIAQAEQYHLSIQRFIDAYFTDKKLIDSASLKDTPITADLVLAMLRHIGKNKNLNLLAKKTQAIEVFKALISKMAMEQVLRLGEELINNKDKMSAYSYIRRERGWRNDVWYQYGNTHTWHVLMTTIQNHTLQLNMAGKDVHKDYHGRFNTIMNVNKRTSHILSFKAFLGLFTSNHVPKKAADGKPDSDFIEYQKRLL